MMHASRRRSACRLAGLALAILLTPAACDRAATEPTVAGQTVREIILRQESTGEYIYSHRDHWHGAPAVRAGRAEGLQLFFTAHRMAADDHNPPPVEKWFTLADKPEYEVRAVVEDPTVAEWAGDRVRGELRGRRAGASRISFVVRRSGTTIYEAPPLNFRVLP